MADEWERMVRQKEDACLECGVRFRPGDEIVAALQLGEEGFERHDRCATCFEKLNPETFSFWRMRRAQRAASGPRRLDLAYLTEFFKRLEGRDEPHSRQMAWLVGLLLLRKKVVELAGRRVQDDHEILDLRLKREDRIIPITDPKLTDEAMAGLHHDLARIFNLDDEIQAEKPAPSDGASSEECAAPPTTES